MSPNFGHIANFKVLIRLGCNGKMLGKTEIPSNVLIINERLNIHDLSINASNGNQVFILLNDDEECSGSLQFVKHKKNIYYFLYINYYGKINSIFGIDVDKSFYQTANDSHHYILLAVNNQTTQQFLYRRHLLATNINSWIRCKKID